MSTLYIGLTIALVFIAIGLIALVLLQKGKGADAGAAFGAGASGTVFGARGSTNFLSRTTAILACLFFANCLALAYLSAKRGGPESLLDDSLVIEEPSLIPAGDDAEDVPATLEIPTSDDASTSIEIPAEDTGDTSDASDATEESEQ
ncbi:MAG: preprotein translocase subunit SecG [Pseudomonadota bacterium]